MGTYFLEYFDPAERLEDLVASLYERHSVHPRVREAIGSFLAVLNRKHTETYRHSLRVGILGARIGEYVGIDPKPLFYGGLLHDIGKTLVDPAVLSKQIQFNESDRRVMKSHVMDGYRMLRGILDFTADVIVRHHAFQEHGYPSTLPAPLHPYGPDPERRLDEFGRLLSIADVYDAAHRVNDRGKGIRTGEDIRYLIFRSFPDRVDLIAGLYDVGIFTTRIY